MLQTYPGSQSIDGVCKCRSMEDLLRVWDMETSAVSLRGVADGEKAKDNGGGIGDAMLLHQYDDRHFLDPEGFQKVRLREEKEKEEWS